MVNYLKQLKKWIEKAPANFQKWRYRESYKKAVKHANHVKNTSGHKCIVLFVDDRYRAFTKRSIKFLCQSKYFKKGTTVQKIESMAVYTTH